MMNPTLKKIIPVVIHVLFCAVILLVPLFVMARNGTIDYRHYSGYIVRTSVLIFLFYFNYLFLINELLFKRKISLYFFINILVIVLLVVAQNFMFDFLRGTAPPLPMKRHMDGPPPILFRLGDYVLIIFVVGMSVAMKATMRWYKDSMNLEVIKAAQLEADLKSLRNQLNPHFLFNTLNNIYSLIACDAEKAQESVHRLSNLLRYVLYENDQKFVPVEKEIEFTQNYIDLMRLRLNSNVRLNVIIRNQGCNNKIASLMFITLIENAFKHGVSSDKDCFIDIKILVENDKGILCTVENSCIEPGNNIEANNKGIGLANLEKRLKLLYPNRYQFVVKQNNDIFSVLLRIDFDNDQKMKNEA